MIKIKVKQSFQITEMNRTFNQKINEQQAYQIRLSPFIILMNKKTACALQLSTAKANVKLKFK